MISHHYKAIFVHIPKNAGQSIESVFLQLLGLDWRTRAPLLLQANPTPELGPPRLAHLLATDYVSCQYIPLEMYNSYYKFAFVRDPWSRTVSMYKYLGYANKMSFKRFLMDEYRNGLFLKKFWFVRPQADFIYDDHGNLIVDYIGRFERLQDDFDHVCRRLMLPRTVLPHVNQSRLPKQPSAFSLGESVKAFAKRLLTKPATLHADFRGYYDAEAVKVVAELYGKDVDCFGYEFG